MVNCLTFILKSVELWPHFFGKKFGKLPNFHHLEGIELISLQIRRRWTRFASFFNSYWQNTSFNLAILWSLKKMLVILKKIIERAHLSLICPAPAYVFLCHPWSQGISVRQLLWVFSPGPYDFFPGPYDRTHPGAKLDSRQIVANIICPKLNTPQLAHPLPSATSPPPTSNNVCPTPTHPTQGFFSQPIVIGC